MCKKLISFFIAMCLSFNIITVFGDELPSLREFSPEMSVSEESSNVLSAENFTDDNIIYKALQDKNEEVSLFNDNSADEINVSFDIVLGFDMSSDMYGFDYNGEMTWKDDFSAIQEQAPVGTRFSVVTAETGETGEFRSDLSLMGTLPDTYSESTDIVTLLKNCANIFDDESSERNKVVIAVIGAGNNIEVLENEMYELRSEGIIPFVFVLDAENKNEFDDIDGIYRCRSSLELRLAISDLYLSFAEFDSAAENMTANDDEYSVMPFNDSNLTPNDYKSEKHEINGYESDIGKALISVLNIYGAVPMYISSTSTGNTGYNILDGNTSNDDIANFKKAYNAELSSDLVNKMFPVWENIFQQIKNNDNDFITDVDTAIENNIKRRFPVIAFDENVNSIEILTGSTVAEEYTYALDTYKYLMEMVTRANVAVTEDTSVDRAEKIILNYPIAADASYKLYGYEAKTENVSPPEDPFSKSNLSCELNMMLSSNITSINYAIGIETKYYNGMPDMIYTNRFYISRGYTDLIQGTWYRDFVLDATNKGFVQGMGDGTFSPEGTLTRGQFLVMLLNAADVDLDDYDEIGFTNYENSETLSLVQSKMPEWARKYMNYALKNLLINETQYIGDIESDVPKYGFEQELNRAETAYILYMMFIGNLESIRVPSNIYFYDSNISNYKTELWNKHRAFVEQQEENSALNNMNYVQQMYYNNVLDGMPGNAGEGDDPSKIYFYPNKTLTRAEACKVVLKCLFELNDNIPEIQANIFEDDVEVVPLPDGDHIKDRYVLDSIPFDATNQILYEFHVDDNKEYAIETTGGSADTTTWGRLYYVDGNSTINNITLDGSNHMLIVFQGEGDYRLRIKRTGNDDVGLRIKELGVSDFDPYKKSDSNYIYINHPEFIASYDIIDDSYSMNRKIFEEWRISGKNTYFQTHLTWYANNNDPKTYPKQEFYLDVDFYNPSDADVVINIQNLAYGVGCSDAIKYFNGMGETFDLTVPAKEHKLLLGGQFAISQQSGVRTEPTIMFDFDVQNGTEVIVSSMAAYNSKNLVLKANSTNIVENTGVTLSAETVSDNNSRPSEPDLMEKYLGIAENQSCEIYTDLYYVISNNISGNLNVNLIDELYANNFNKEVDTWTTNINPINDYYYSVNNSIPSSLHEFTYHYGDYRRWQFDFQHKNMAFMNPDTDVNASVNAPVSEDAINQLKYYASKQKTEDDVGSIDEDAMSLGEWGTIYHYNITIKNAGKERTLIFGINTHDSKNIVRYLVNGVSDVKWFDVGSTNEPISIPITLEANSVTNIEFEYMLVYGAAGTGNFLSIE